MKQTSLRKPSASSAMKKATFAKTKKSQPSIEKAEKYLQNLLEPTKPFVTPGPAAWVYPMAVRASVPLDTSDEFGYVIAMPSFSSLLTLPGNQTNEAGWSTGSVETRAVAFMQYSIDADLGAIASGATVRPVVVPVAGYATFSGEPGFAYYPGSWTGAAVNVVLSGLCTSASTVTLRIIPYDPATGVMGTALTNSGSWAANVASTVTINVSATFPAGFVLIVSRTGNDCNMTAQISFPLTRSSGPVSRTLSLSSVFVDRPSIMSVINESQVIKISGFSARLQNATPELTRGGKLNMAFLPPGCGPNLPLYPKALHAFLGTTQPCMAGINQPLQKGGHISSVPQTVELMKMHHIAESPGYADCSPLIFTWQQPTVGGQVTSQTLSLEILLNIECITLNPSLQLRMRNQGASDLVLRFFASVEIMENAWGENPDHVARVRKIVKKFLAHPATRLVAQAAMASIPLLL